MTSRDFVIWLKGFSEACHDFHPTPKQWDRIKEVLYETEDYNDNPDLDDEDGWSDWYQKDPHNSGNLPLTGSISTSNPNITVSFTSGSSASAVTATVWNDKMGNWHYTNYPEGFGYYHAEKNKQEKTLLND
jgi:phospholipase C